MEKLKLTDFPEVIELLESRINTGKITEVKRERGKDGRPVIAVVGIERTLKYPAKD